MIMAHESTSNLAVLIDADNASSSTTSGLLSEVAKYGTAHVKRAYGDWTTNNLYGWKNELLNHSIQPMQQFAYTQGKNSTDSAMIIDAMDLLYSSRFDGFCLVSSDSDFTRLATRIREAGLIVYGFGRQTTPRPFVAACNKFIYTENLVYHGELVQHPVRVVVPKDHTLVKNDEAESHLTSLLHTTIETLADNDGWAALSSVGNLLTKKHPDFDPRSYGYSQLGHLVSDLPLFESVQRFSQKGKSIGIYVRDKRRGSQASAS